MAPDKRPRSKRAPRSDGAATRAAILEAAGRLSASAGYAHVTSTKIAAEAGVDLASINHHFGNRDGLYQALLIEAHRRLIDSRDLEAIVQSEVSAEEKLRDMLRVFLSAGRSPESWPLTVLAREIIAPTAHFGALEALAVAPKMKLGLSILSELTGRSADDALLWQCLPCIMGPCALYGIIGRLNVRLLDPITSQGEEALLSTVHKFVLAGLRSL